MDVASPGSDEPVACVTVETPRWLAVWLEDYARRLGRTADGLIREWIMQRHRSDVVDSARPDRRDEVAAVVELAALRARVERLEARVFDPYE
jgi:hypothetical protein